MNGTRNAVLWLGMKEVTSGKRILLIDDDDQAVRQATKLLLSIDRHSVTEAENGIEGLALAAAQPFDLVVVDFFMPGIDGGEVARRIKHIAPSLPILMITAYLEKLTGFDKTRERCSCQTIRRRGAARRDYEAPVCATLALLSREQWRGFPNLMTSRQTTPSSRREFIWFAFQAELRIHFCGSGRKKGP